MLYKKYHRQYLREWRIGRKFKYNHCSSGIFEVTGKPYICGRNIQIDEVDRFDEYEYDTVIALESGKMSIKNIITWLD